MKDLPWIAADVTVKSMPRFRREFTLDRVPRQARLKIAGLGYYVLFLNGRRADEAHLAPTFSRYDVRTWFRELDVTRFLHEGINVCEVQLGGGWYAGELADVHGNQHASYRSVPKFALRLFSARTTLLASDETWRCAESAVLADSPRNGETFDARRKTPDAWLPVRVTAGPGGNLVCSEAPPVREQPPIAPIKIQPLTAGRTLYDFGVNLTGAVRLAARGPAGSEIVLRYGELQAADGGVSQDNINWYVQKGECQTDRYTLSGDAGGETWQPEFSFHGFRYVEITCPETCEIRTVAAIPLRSDFAETGTFRSDSKAFNALLDVTRRTLASNFIGYPMDCPHREKNGWLADAHLAADSLLAWFDAGKNYAEYVDTIFDYQRPDGHLPGMVPGSGHGWHWDFGPVWDSAPLLIGYTLWQQSGDLALLRRHYRDFRRYFDFYRTLFVDGFIRFGAAEWCAPQGTSASDERIVCSAYLCRNFRLMAEIAAALGHAQNARHFAAEAAELRARIRTLKPRTLTEIGVLLECGIGDAALAENLAQRARESHFHADFGIVGAKAVPRALAQYGYIDEAMEYFLQPEFPGWQWMLRQGATTLWETWDGKQSQNHPMLGDVAGWAKRYLAGFSIAAPGGREVVIAPQFPQKLHSFEYSENAAAGCQKVSWLRHDRSVEVSIDLPRGVHAQVNLPGIQKCVAGKAAFTVKA